MLPHAGIEARTRTPEICERIARDYAGSDLNQAARHTLGRSLIWINLAVGEPGETEALLRGPGALGRTVWRTPAPRATELSSWATWASSLVR
jgi:hypothetical protein